MMHSPNIILWCYVLLVASFSDSRGNSSLRISTNNDEQRDNLTVHLFSTKDRNNQMQLILYYLFYNFLNKNVSQNNGKKQYEPHINSMNKDRMDSVWSHESAEHVIKIHSENNQISMEFRANFTKIIDKDNSMLRELNENLTKTKDKGNSTSYELYRSFNRNNYNDVNIVSYEACGNKTCIQLCCPFGDRLTSERKCVAGQDNYSFPDVYQNNSESKKLNDLFQLTIRNPCVLQGSAHRILSPDEYLFLNGSLYRYDSGELVPSMSYCLAILDRNIYDAIICMNQIGFPTYISVCHLVSLPFLLLTFIVYSILPEVQNIHNCTLRVHVASLFIVNMIIFCVQEIPELSEWKYCSPLAYIFNFSLLSCCFWLNVTCFDIWWTFKKLNLHQSNSKIKKKKFIMYSIYAWGLTFIHTVACAIMDHAPGIPKNLIRPEMCKKKFWIGRHDALTVYFYGPMGVTFISNIYFFVDTTLTILYHNKYTAHQLRDSESCRYNNKKRKFGMYLKLFIVMGSFSRDLILWFINASNSVPKMIWNINYMIDAFRGPIIFIIYVCKRKILRLLLKRFGWQDNYCFGTFIK